MIDEAQLDLLVDGELGDVERRELLARLDTEPDGWRRCAVAFLEAQAWREELRAVAGDSTESAAKIASNGQSSHRWLRTVLAMAASFVLAFSLGLAVDDLSARNDSPALTAQHDEPVAETAPREEALEVESPSPRSEQLAPQTEIPYRYVTIPTRNPSSGENDSLRMPVIPHEYLGQDWPYRLPAVVPDEVVQTLRQRGHDVVQQRRLVPLQAADGSRVVFPVDEVELVPVASRGYQ